MMTRLILAILPLALCVSGCSDAEEPAEISDPSKLSEELEAEAQEIEQRADRAVREAEAVAERELQQLRAEAVAADTADQRQDPADDAAQ